MSKLILDSDLRAKLNGLSERIEICDESDQPLGVFLPFKEYQKLLGRAYDIPLSPEEIERRRKEKGGCSLEEFWRKMGQA